MICLPIMALSNAEVERLFDLAAAEPADLYELRFDRLNEEPDVEGLIAMSNRPVLATCRSAAQGGYFKGTADDRAAILQRAIDAGAAYVDAEEDVIIRLKRRDGVVLMASWHDFEGTPDTLSDVVARLEALPCDWVKFASMATKPADNQTVLEAVVGCRKPAVGIAMGEMGLPSRVLGLAFGSRITFGALAAGKESAPGQPSAADLADFYRVDHLTRKTTVYGLLGFPVAQSRGYRIHNRAFSMTGIDAVYIPFLCRGAGDFTDSFADALNVRGLSVTIPHKQAVLSRASRATEEVKKIGAANTLIRTKDGWDADNFDYHAVVSVVGDRAREHGIDLSGSQALLIGGGGAARAVGVALTTLGCRVHVTGRNEDKIARLAEEMGWIPVLWQDREKQEWRVVANATPIGMHPDSESTPFDGSAWRKGMIAFDAVHHPSRTRFVCEAEAAGAWSANGMDMFTRQAALQFKAWTGKDLPAECIQTVLG